ncbi:Cyclic di-GMP binding protein YcgR [Salmonella enterica subsp. enterica]|uniref:Cyclic di-GMP binding protein YcgR n=1 Tax=Salmonella enterica I TaxID=59201 RepID=A0A3S4J0L7_SALET|nr:Cyclic di-GMP binding protein YcgR [Salmonella enterica subsp. enterica]
MPQLVTGEYQRLPAFITPLPSSLWFVQRREYFRIGAPLYPPYYGVTTLPDTRTLRFRLFDLPWAAWARYWNPPSPTD